MFINPAMIIPAVAAIVAGTDFSDPTIGRAFDSIVSLHNAGVSLFDAAIAERELKAIGVGNAAALIKASKGVPNESGAIYHADRIRNLSRLRGVAALLDETREQLFTDRVRADEVLGFVDSQVARLRSGVSSSARDFGDICDEVIAEMQDRVGHPEPSVLLSGMPGADNAGFVMGAGELCVLAARPGVGKTALATQIAMHHADKGRRVLMASLEMRDRDLVKRVLVSAAGHNHQWIRTNRIYQEQVDDMRRASAETLGRPPLSIWSPGRVKCGMIHATAAVIKAAHGLRLLIVDYLGYVKSDDPRKERYEQVGEITKSLRDIGQHLQIPVLCLAQLNREGASAEPKLSNLRESGDIEQDADVVAFLHPSDPKDRTRVDLIVAKDRQGAAGRTALLWHPEQTRFEDTSRGREWDATNDSGDNPYQREFK